MTTATNNEKINVQQKSSIPAITGEIDESKAVHILPTALSPWKPTIMSYTASLASTVVGFPLDSIKTRMQTHYFHGAIDCFKKTVKHEGLQGLYRGISAPLLSISFSKSLGVSLYTFFKPKVAHAQQILLGTLVPNLSTKEDKLSHLTFQQKQRRLTLLNIPTSYFAGSLTGVCVSFFACPFEFTKLYSQIVMLENKRATKVIGAPSKDQALSATGVAASSSNLSVAGSNAEMKVAHSGRQRQPVKPKTSIRAPSTLEVTREIIKSEGIFGLYSGMKLHLIREFISSGLYFAVYETAKLTINNSIADKEGKIKGTNVSLGPLSIAIAGAMSGVISWITIFPIDTVKSLTQRDIMSNIIRRQNGLEKIKITRKLTIPTRRMYRGLSVSVSRSVLNSIVFFGAFEYLMKHLA